MVVSGHVTILHSIEGLKMPHAALKLIPGVDTQKTPALNEVALSQTNLIRFLPDRTGMGLPQKLGGWTKYYPNTISSAVRNMKSWQDLNEIDYLALGAETNLTIIFNGNGEAITPLQSTLNGRPAFSFTLGSYLITDTETASYTNIYSYVYYITPVSVGGTKLFGAYAISNVISADQFQVTAGSPATYTSAQTATITNASPAVITVTTAPANGTIVKFTTTGTLPTGITAGQGYFVKSATATTFQIALTPTGTSINTSSAGSGTHTATFPGQVAYFTTSIGTPTVSVLFPNHGLGVNSSFSVSVATTVGGIPLSGVYSVTDVADANNFSFVAQNSATSTASGFENGSDVRSVIYYATIPQPAGSGYGVGGYGVGGYGSGAGITPTAGTAITATDWSLDNWGEILLANPMGGPIYYWVPNGIIQNLQIIEGGPLANTGMFVAMPQRQVIAYGSTETGSVDPLLIKWSDVENFTVWDATVTNQAGSYRIPTGSRIVGGLQANQQGLLWTDLDLWAMQYIGPPFVYGFNKIKSNCGLIARGAVANAGDATYWMSQKQFFSISGTGVESLACPVWDIIYQNLKSGNDANGHPYTDRIRCGTNAQFNEVTWFYPSAESTGENDSYVKYNTAIKQWDYGTMSRSAWIDQSVIGPPIGADPANGYIYQHETSNDADGQAMLSSFQTGYLQVNEADNLVFLDQVWPDFKWGQYSQTKNANVKLTFYGTDYPGDTPVQFGPYNMTQATQFLTTRIRARLISIKVSSDDVGTFWRLGDVRYRFQPDGRF
jgi:hypothetical protein